jgi:hypothetical protein
MLIMTMLFNAHGQVKFEQMQKIKKNILWCIPFFWEKIHQISKKKNSSHFYLSLRGRTCFVSTF